MVVVCAVHDYSSTVHGVAVVRAVTAAGVPSVITRQRISARFVYVTSAQKNFCNVG